MDFACVFVDSLNPNTLILTPATHISENNGTYVRT